MAWLLEICAAGTKESIVNFSRKKKQIENREIYVNTKY